MAKLVHRRAITAIGIVLAGAGFTLPLLVRRSRAGDGYPASTTRRIVVPYAAGGTADSLGRVVAQILSDSTGSAFIIENRSGAGGNVGAEIVARAAPDGQTLLLGTVGTAVTNPYLDKYIPYDSEWSFAPVALIGEVTNVVVVHPSFPADTLEALVDYCKEREPGRVVYGSPGIGSAGHLSMEYLQSQACLRLKHVAYGSRRRLIKDVLAGRVQIAMDNLPPYLRYIRSGELRALGVSSATRWFAAPDVPTIAEQGYPGFQTALWWYVAAPAGTRLALVRRLSDDIVKGVRSEAAIGKIRAAGAVELPGTSEQLAEHIRTERIKWKRVIDAAGLTPR